MKITSLHVRDFKRVKDLTIEPDADRALVLIGGKNGQGKSSTLDALSAAFGGKRALPSDPVRHGADNAEVSVELDGELVIKRVIKPDGESTLEIRDKMGARRAPQQIVDGLISGRFLDPLQFLSLPAKEQRAQLMKLIPDAARIETLDAKREKVFEARTNGGRDLTKAQGELARLPVVEVGAPIVVTDLTTELKQLGERQRQIDTIRSKREAAERATSAARTNLENQRERVATIEEQIRRLADDLVAAKEREASLVGLVDKYEDAEAEATKAVDDLDEEIRALEPKRTKLEAELAGADEHNQAIYAAQAQAKRRAEAAAEVERLTKEREDLTKVLETIDARKAEILAAARLPVPGLGVTADGIELDGVPFQQASGAEKMRVALALAIAASPNLDDIWVRDAALLDEDSLAAVGQQAEAAGKRLWLERVSDKDPGVIVIRDGKVVTNGAAS